MKSPTLTHTDDCIKSLKAHLLRNDFLKRTAQAPMDSSDDEAPDRSADHESPSHQWNTIAEVPHMELTRRFLTIRPQNDANDNKLLQVPTLELKCSQHQLRLTPLTQEGATITHRSRSPRCW